VPKVRVGNVVRDTGRAEVQVVEHIVGIKTELKSGVFAEYGRFEQAKALGQRGGAAVFSRFAPVFTSNPKIRGMLEPVGLKPEGAEIIVAL
jgi:hypothetical protein